MVTRYLVVHAVPQGPAPDAVRATLARVAEAASDAGIRAIETLYSPEKGVGYTYVEAGSEAQVRSTLAKAGVVADEVFPAERVHTGLLDEPRRDRYA